MELKTATYQVNIENGKLVMARDLTFEGGDTLSFKVTLPDEAKKGSLADLHRASGQQLIDFLQEWITPKQP